MPALRCRNTRTLSGLQRRVFALSNDTDAEEELIIDGCRVVWSCEGQNVRKALTCEAPVLQVALCTFDGGEGTTGDNSGRNEPSGSTNSSSQRVRTTGAYLCVLMSTGALTVISPQGSVHDVSVPFQGPARLWPTRWGVLVEALSDASYIQSEESLSHADPVLFSLRHPLLNLLPVSLADDFLCDPQERILYMNSCSSNTALDLMVSHNMREQCTRVWRLHDIAGTGAEPELRDPRDPARAGDDNGGNDGVDGDVSMILSKIDADGDGDASLHLGASVSAQGVEEVQVQEHGLRAEIKLVPICEVADVFDGVGSDFECFMLQQLPRPRSVCSQSYHIHSGQELPLLLCMFCRSARMIKFFELPCSLNAAHVQNGQMYNKFFAAEPCFSLPCRAVAPVGATSTSTHDSNSTLCREFVAVDMSGVLGLFRGTERLCDVQIPIPDMLYFSHFKNCNSPTDCSVTAAKLDLEHAQGAVSTDESVGNRLTLRLKIPWQSTGTRPTLHSSVALRASLSLEPTSLLVASVCNALDEVLPAKLAAALRCDCLKHFNDAEDNLSEWERFTQIFPLCLGAKSETQGSAPMDAWQHLQASEYHRSYERAHPDSVVCLWSSTASANTTSAAAMPTAPQDKLAPALQTTGAQFMEHMTSIFEALHLLYEQCRLDTLLAEWLMPLGSLLLAIANREPTLSAFADHYRRGSGTLCEAPVGNFVPGALAALVKRPPFETYAAVPDIFAWVEQCIRGSDGGHTVDFPLLHCGPCGGSGNTLARICYFYGQSDIYGAPRADIGKVSGCGVCSAESLVMRMVHVNYCQSMMDMLPPGVALPLREAIASCRDTPPSGWPPAAYILVGRTDLALLHGDPGTTGLTSAWGVATGLVGSTATIANTGETSDADGLRLMEQLTTLRFGRDRRISEVCRLLRSSRPLFLKVARRPEASDHEHQNEQQKMLLMLCKRSMALPPGRGMFTLATLRPLLTEPLPIPNLSLAGRVPPNNATIELNIEGYDPAIASWPEFHNGVAAALRLAPGVTRLTRTWIVYHRDSKPTPSHAGFLLGLGLHGHLSSLSMPDLYRYVNSKHELTTIAVLLGMAAVKRGTMDLRTAKLLKLHTESLLPATIAEGEGVPVAVQPAALIGLGLLYQGTSHPVYAKFLLAEIGRRPGSDRCKDREGYSLAAALALGLVTLGKGGGGKADASDDADARRGVSSQHVQERLYVYMFGGNEPVETSTSGSAPEMAARCSRVHEGDRVNCLVTAPGATLALGLMYIRSGNKAVAARLALPETHFLLDFVRPDLLMLRVIARCLVLWDDIKPDLKWLNSHIPEVVRRAFCKCSNTTAPGVRSHPGVSEDFDRDTVRQAHANIIAGACFALGLKYAGSAHRETHELLSQMVQHFVRLRNNLDPGACPDRSTLEMCLGTTAQALALVMAGTGELSTMRLIRSLRAHIDPHVTFGHHMALNMAMGLLFLGGGSFSIGTDNESVAALLISLFPRYPSCTTDNRCHLQAFRHLYVLAVKPRCVNAIDVDSGAPVYVPLLVTLKETCEHRETQLKMWSPCLLPDMQMVRSIEVCSPRYFRLRLDIAGSKRHATFLRNKRCVFVQRKAGHLSYELDAKAVRGLHARSFAHNSESIRAFGNKADFVRSFTDDPAITAFSRFFCRGSGSLATFCSAILYDCMIRQHSEMLDTYLVLFNAVERLCDLNRSVDIASIRLVLTFYEHHVVRSARENNLNREGQLRSHSVHVFQPDFVASVRERARSFFDRVGLQNELQEYINSGNFPKDAAKLGVFSSMLVFFGIPPPFVGPKAAPGAVEVTAASRGAFSAVLLRRALLAAAARDSLAVPEHAQ